MGGLFGLFRGRLFRLEVDITEKVKKILRFGPLVLLVLVVLIAGGVYAYQHGQSGLTIYDAKVASTMVTVRTQTNGTLTEFTVEDGAHVEAGEVIAHIEAKVTDEDIAQLEQNLALAKQNLAQVQQGQTITVPSAAPAPAAPAAGNSQAVANAQARLNRMNELYAMGAVSAMQRDQAAADLAAAQSASAPAPPAASRSVQTIQQPANPEAVHQAELAVKQAEAALTNAKQDAQTTEIVAPVAGTVYLADGIEAGSEIKAGQAVASIGDATNLWVEAKVSPDMKDKLRLGQFARYTIDGKEYQGTITDISDSADTASADKSHTEAEPADDAAASEDDSGTSVKIADSSESDSTSADDAQNADVLADAKGTDAGEQPADTSDGRLTIKISVPEDATGDLRPGAEAVVKFSLS